jgi:alkylhydroperoxidase family enzyme
LIQRDADRSLVPDNLSLEEYAMRIPVLHSANVLPASRQYVAKTIAHNGFLPSLIGILAHSPAALETYMTIGAINTATSLGPGEREVVQLTAASLHGCGCGPADRGVRVHGKASAGDDRLDALASFTRAVVMQRGAVSDRDYHAFLAHGYGPRQALDVILGVSLATLCNFANALAQTDIERDCSHTFP